MKHHVYLLETDVSCKECTGNYNFHLIPLETRLYEIYDSISTNTYGYRVKRVCSSTKKKPVDASIFVRKFYNNYSHAAMRRAETKECTCA